MLALRRLLVGGDVTDGVLRHELRLEDTLQHLAVHVLGDRKSQVVENRRREVEHRRAFDLLAAAQVGAGGLGCEPASAASVAGVKVLRREGIIASGDRVVCILTGHQLKDPTATVAYHTTDQEQFNKVLGNRGVRRASFANRAVAVPNELDEIVKAIQLYS